MAVQVAATPKLARIIDAVKKKFPDVTIQTFSCRHIAGSSSWSQHAWANAADIFRAGAPASLDPVHAFLKRNEGAFGGFCELIFRQQAGGSPHLDHIHVSGAPCKSGTPPCAGGGGPGVGQTTLPAGGATPSKAGSRIGGGKVGGKVGAAAAPGGAAYKGAKELRTLGIVGWNHNHEGATAVLGRLAGFYLPNLLKVAGGGILAVVAVLGLVAIAFMARDAGTQLSRSLKPVTPRNLRKRLPSTSSLRSERGSVTEDGETRRMSRSEQSDAEALARELEREEKAERKRRLREAVRGEKVSADENDNVTPIRSKSRYAREAS